jgi:ubiquinone/menaquinone biosynthesis C-methylase UbiE
MHKCNICGGQLIRTLLTILEPDRFEKHIGVVEGGYCRRWVECNQCGSATNVYDSYDENRLALLESAYYQVDLNDVDLAERYQKLMSLPNGRSDNRERVQRVLEWQSEWQGRDFSVIDIGAGTGVFLSRLLAEGGERISQAVAIEPDPHAAAHLLSLGVFEVIHATFPLPFESQSFDLVTLNKVLEHITAPVDFLSQLSRLVSINKGIIYVEVPDILTALLRAPDDNILGSLHRHLYSPEGLAIALRLASLLPIRIERITEPSGKVSVYAFATTNAYA